MKHIAFLILTIIGQAQYIQYQSDYSSIWTGPYADGGQNQEITFPQQFSTVPQISVHPLIFSNSYEGKTFSGFSLSAGHITTSSFTVFLTIGLNTNSVGFATFYWIAIDDTRLTILSFNDIGPSSITYSHTNSRADTGIIILTGFRGTTTLDFTLSLGVITSTTVEVNVYHQNLYTIGYVVILGPSECFDIETQIVQLPLDQYDSNVYKSRQVTKETNKIWLFYFQYLTFELPGSYRLQLEPTFTSTTSEYKFSSWGDSISKFTKCAHQCATLKFLPINSNAMLFQKIRISGLILKTQTENFDFSIVGIDFTYIPIIMNQKIVVPQNTQSLTFLVKVKCSQNYKITSSFYQCSSCSSKYNTIIRKCYHSEMTLQYYITFNIQDINYKQNLVINMITTQLKIQQTIYDHEVPTDFLIGQIDFQL